MTETQGDTSTNTGMNARRKKRVFFIAATLVAAAFVASICIGKYPISLSEIGQILTGGEVSEIKRNVFFNLRVPRTILALMAGAGLGMAGAVYQTIFKNPLASPDIIGVANGANLGAAVAIVLFGYNTLITSISAFLGGMLVMLLVVALVRSTGAANTTTYILAGIILKAVSEALIMILKFYADPAQELAAMEFWSMGSFGSITAEKLLVILPIFLTGFIGLILLRRQVALLGLEEDESRALGVRVKAVRIAVLSFSTLTVTSIICLTGLINFVGLIAPHIARLVLKRTSFAANVFASLAGAFILLVADCLARSIYSTEVPISILTTLIGVPVLIYFMRSRKARRI
ncbi:iron ABC transporter permease [Christensenellaceae bacterium OttesenSCG-928-L17]|nr:iron ABC transporter permease [Christensenellaceae bacterium OttesenSCG-928-L17]